MKTKTKWLAMLAVVAALTSAQTVRAITFGEPDNGRHANVGALMFIDYQNPVNPDVAMCFSGTLIRSNVFLTAGHCSASLEWILWMEYCDLGNYYVTFHDDPYDQSYWLPIAGIRTHPGYNPAKVTDEEFIDALGAGSVNSEDVGVIILEEPTDIQPAELPPVGFLDELKDAKLLTRDSEFLAVGYGSRATFSPPGSEYVPHGREQVTSGYMSLDKRWLNLSMNPVLGNGGGGYGDSGGPRFWIDPANGSEHLVAVTSRGDPKLVALDATFRIDTPTVLDFIRSVEAEIDSLGFDLGNQ